MEKNQPLVGRLIDPMAVSEENPPVDKVMNQQSELLDMIAGGIAGLASLSAERNFPTEKINALVEAEVKKQFDEKSYVETQDLNMELDSRNVVYTDTFEDQLSDHSVLTVDSELAEYFDLDDIVDKVIDQIEITRK
jgi:hypothetical protein